mgnify:FL=1
MLSLDGRPAGRLVTSMAKGTGIRVLLIEDDAAVARSVVEGLARRKCAVEHAPTLVLGKRALAKGNPDAVILDLTLPDGSGLDLADGLRAAGNQTPILMLTARDAVSDRVAGFRHGADDYLCKPFDIDELFARLEAIVRRTKGREPHVLQYGGVRLDLVTHTVERGELTAVLSAREAELLAYLLRHSEQTLSRERILQQVWGVWTEDDSNVVNVYVNYLRNKIERGALPRIIHTIRGVGYVLSEREPDEPRG